MESATQTKSVRLVSDRPPKDIAVEVNPSDTAANVLEKASLSAGEYHLLKPGDRSYFDPTEPVWNDAIDGGKLHFVARSKVGAWPSFRKGAASAAPNRVTPTHVAPFTLQRPNIGRARLTTYAEDLGWRPRPRPDGVVVHVGSFRALGLEWEGCVYENQGDLQFFMKNPPISMIRKTEYGGCFHASQTPGWFKVSFMPGATPSGLSSGIAAINVMLSEVYKITEPSR